MSSAVRQDGRSASLLAPNGTAQRTLMLVVLGRAALVSSQVLYVEAHGTGTALGDPTEVGSLSLVHRSVERDSALVVGAVKANMGHSETPSGLAGLIKVNAQLLGATKTGNAHLRLLNPLLAQQVAGFAFPTQGNGGRDSSLSAVSGVSSFGISGTIVHLLVTRNLSVRERDSFFPVSPLLYTRRAFLWHMESQLTNASVLSGIAGLPQLSLRMMPTRLPPKWP